MVPSDSVPFQEDQPRDSTPAPYDILKIIFEYNSTIINLKLF